MVRSSYHIYTLLLTYTTSELQSGVIAVIVAALLIVFGVILYAIFHKIVTAKKRNKKK